MMNIRDLGSKENLRIKFRDHVGAESCLKLWFESGWYFCHITELG